MKFFVLFLAVFSLTGSLPAQIALTAHIDGRSVALSHASLPRHFESAHPFMQTLRWDTLQPGLEVSELNVEAGRLGVDIRIVIARIEPAHFAFSLVHKTRANRMTGAWNVDAAPEDAAVALNAGQFKETGPWGWLVLDADERRDPGYGPLSLGIAFDTAGRVLWLPFDQLAPARVDRSIRFGFQSYPTLLFSERVPALAASKSALDLDHRDARLILAEDRSGRLLVILTRYDGLGAATSRVPIGLTVPESIVLAGALGARHAVMLDGGVSAQLLLRRHNGGVRAWKGMRDVPLALIATPRVH